MKKDPPIGGHSFVDLCRVVWMPLFLLLVWKGEEDIFCVLCFNKQKKIFFLGLVCLSIFARIKEGWTSLFFCIWVVYPLDTRFLTPSPCLFS